MSGVTFKARTAGGPNAAITAVRQAVRKAERGRVLRMVLRQGRALALLGIVLAGAYVLTKVDPLVALRYE